MKEINTDSIPLTADPVMALKNTSDVYELKRENIMLRMRLVKIMVLLENVKNSMEKAKDGIMAQLCDTSLEIGDK
jgi:hypothetical protein